MIAKVPPKSPSVEMKRQPVKVEREPDLRVAGRIIPPEHPAYRIMRQMILKKYHMDK